MLHEVVENEALEMVLAMLGRHFRELYWVQNDAQSMKLPSWRTSKLKSQAHKFQDNSLSEFITNLAEIDVNSKTGKGDLAIALDLLLLTRLK